MYICDPSPTGAGSQLSFVTVQGTVVPIATMGIATVHNSRKVTFFLFERGVATVYKGRNSLKLFKKNTHCGTFELSQFVELTLKIIINH